MVVDEINIRDFAPDDAAAVRALFIRVNRRLAPADMRDAFEGYIARADGGDRPERRILWRT
jgi:hypothetical protein